MSSVTLSASFNPRTADLSNLSASELYDALESWFSPKPSLKTNPPRP